MTESKNCERKEVSRLRKKKIDFVGSINSIEKKLYYKVQGQKKSKLLPCSNKDTTKIPSTSTKRARTMSSISLLTGREQYFQIQQ